MNENESLMKLYLQGETDMLGEKYFPVNIVSITWTDLGLNQRFRGDSSPQRFYRLW